MIIDSHTHIFSPDVIAHRERYAKRDAFFGTLYSGAVARMIGAEELIAAMDAAGVPVDPELVSCGRFQVEEGIERGRALLARPDRPTAIITGNDLQALGVYQAARDARLHIPDDLSVVGFDDLPVARWVSPPLTTIRQPLIEMAETAAELVLAIGRGEPTQARLELATELVVRESTAPPAAAPA